ncbi:hypothetical protein FRC14_006424 [Serendipita sp. 396]|nr:hypothetical protein FRC14_006424 [Serendipita sp. 396]
MEEVETFDSGLSHLFPVIPILATVSIVCCLLVFRSFLKTHVFALVYYLWLLLIGNVLLLVNTCVWRRSVVNVPIYADIVARFWHIYGFLLYLSTVCLSKFIWIISRPAPSIKVYDTRRRTNRMDAFICFGVPLLLAPLFFLASKGRYIIIEDFGPWFGVTFSVTAFFVSTVPLMVTSVISITFSCLSCYNFWRARQSGPALNETLIHQRPIIGITYGLIWMLLPWFLADFQPEDGKRPWYAVVGIQANFYHYKETYKLSRGSLDQFQPWTVRNITGFAFTIPIAGIQIFICFGINPESKRIYTRWWCDSVYYIKDSRVYGWGEMFVRNAIRFRRPQVDHNNFTPFLVHDIVMEDLLSTPKDKKDCLYRTPIRRSPLPSPPPYMSPTPHGAKSVPTFPPGLLRQGSRPTLGQQRMDEGETPKQTSSLRSNSDHSLSRPNPPSRKGKSSNLDSYSSQLGHYSTPTYPSPTYAP